MVFTSFKLEGKIFWAEKFYLSHDLQHVFILHDMLYLDSMYIYIYVLYLSKHLFVEREVLKRKVGKKEVSCCTALEKSFARPVLQ